jgi:hypothetical protein
MGLKRDCLDATLMISFIESGHIHNSIFGDGSIIAIDKNEKINYFSSISFEHNAPYYLSYLLDKERDERYKKLVINKRVKIYGDEILPIEYEESAYLPMLGSYELNKLSAFFMTSDGIESFYNYKTGEKVPSLEIVRELISIKSKKGEFLKRRVKRMMEDLSKRDIYNYDDLSVCAFLIEENK